MTAASIADAPLLADPERLPIRYEDDAYGWAVQQAAALREDRLEALDRQNLARTLEQIVAQETAKLEAALDQVLQGLLKWDLRPDARARNWSLTVHQQRRRILRQMRRQAGLRDIVPATIERAYGLARAAVIKDLDLYDDALPVLCPYDWGDVTDRDIAWV